MREKSEAVSPPMKIGHKSNRLIPLFTSNNIQYVASTSGRSNALAHKDAIHWATSPLGVGSKGGMVGSMGVRVQSNYIPEYLSTLTTADILYGVIENRDTFGVLIRTVES